MTEKEMFHLLFNGGNFSLPYLITINNDKGDNYYFVNNNEDVSFEGVTYKASNFEYIEPDINGGGGNLTISGIGNTLIEFVENSNNAELQVIGAIAKDGTIEKFKLYKHFFGSISYDQSMSISYALNSDDRLNMTLTVYTYDTETNQGNA